MHCSKPLCQNNDYQWLGISLRNFPHYQRSYSTPGPVSTTGMGDRIGVQLPVREIYLSLTNHPGQLSLANPPWVGAMSTGQRAVMLCDWGVKADMVLFAGSTV